MAPHHSEIVVSAGGVSGQKRKLEGEDDDSPSSKRNKGYDPKNVPSTSTYEISDKSTPDDASTSRVKTNKTTDCIRGTPPKYGYSNIEMTPRKKKLIKLRDMLTTDLENTAEGKTR
ncbi:uncharacterized protein LOC134669329 [Cydia fagiglandana]|uniref:uncharacterized protein LOC134669329 n=1 Tax=Cydia fagiglandana TaxID=1458189 RepID=UPI002FEE5225